MNQANHRINLLLIYGLGIEGKVVHDKPVCSQKIKAKRHSKSFSNLFVRTSA